MKFVDLYGKLIEMTPVLDGNIFREIHEMLEEELVSAYRLPSTRPRMTTEATAEVMAELRAAAGLGPGAPHPHRDPGRARQPPRQHAGRTARGSKCLWVSFRSSETSRRPGAE